jgi:hypothetical protein
MRLIALLIFLSCNILLFGQQISGTVFELNSNAPIEYVNIGVVGKNIGTVSDENGKYTLQIDPEFHSDTLKFSSIGYYPYSVQVADFIKQNNGSVILEKRDYELAEVIVRPRRVRERTLGATTRNKFAVASMGDSTRMHGGEIGVLMRNNRTAYLKEVNINFAVCTYDVLSYRVNVYKALPNRQFENILTEPVYVTTTKEETENTVTIDVRHLNLVIEGNFLVSIETFKDLGPGTLHFPISLLHRSFFRRTSQGSWESFPFGISISAVVDIER